MKIIRPRNGNVVLKEKDAETTASGIITGTNTKDEKQFIVEAVGDGYLTAEGTRIPINLKPGDIVYVAAGVNYSGFEMEDGSLRLVLNEAQILGVQEDDGVPIVRGLEKVQLMMPN